jgi:hypothetical protein
MSDEKLTCSKCKTPMALIHISLGPSASLHRNFECPSCKEHIETVGRFALTDLADHDVQDWLRAGLRKDKSANH